MPSFKRGGRSGSTGSVVKTLTLDGEMINATQDLDRGSGQISISDPTALLTTSFRTT